MGIVRKPLPVKLFIGLLAADESSILRQEIALANRFGPIDIRGPITRWEHTDYYARELGTVILRKFVFFRDVMDPETLPAIKIYTNSLELSSALKDHNGARRTTNIDPGYLTEAKAVLATTKDYAHRLYLGQGIYGEVELRYSKEGQSYLSVEHSYPDFRSKTTIGLFNQARSNLQQMIREEVTLRHHQR
ncbi:MAG: DUF4416 family protein [Nitrospirota bacterium]|nr:DUF4416 family protein [Nitrospirota bacterium]